MPETILYDVQDKIAVITLNRPEKMNAINDAMARELWDALMDIKNNPDIWVAVITGNGRAFCSGHDLNEPFSGGSGAPRGDDLYLCMLQIYKPIICAINGIALAQGTGLTLCSDIRIAAERVQIGWPQVKRGLSSISGPSLGVHRLPLGWAFFYLFTGRFMTARDAERLNLVQQVVPNDQLMERTMELAREIRANAPLALRFIKEVALRGLETTVEQRVRFAALMIEKIDLTEDRAEGVRAFFEKRAPVWQGR